MIFPNVEIHERLVIRDGIPVCADGTPLAEYLASLGFKEGQEVSLIDRAVLRDVCAAVYLNVCA